MVGRPHGIGRGRTFVDGFLRVREDDAYVQLGMLLLEEDKLLPFLRALAPEPPLCLKDDIRAAWAEVREVLSSTCGDVVRDPLALVVERDASGM